jgi:hypothetical protein
MTCMTQIDQPSYQPLVSLVINWFSSICTQVEPLVDRYGCSFVPQHTCFCEKIKYVFSLKKNHPLRSSSYLDPKDISK